jgi:hypothetical protein
VGCAVGGKISIVLPGQVRPITGTGTEDLRLDNINPNPRLKNLQTEKLFVTQLTLFMPRVKTVWHKPNCTPLFPLEVKFTVVTGSSVACFVSPEGHAPLLSKKKGRKASKRHYEDPGSHVLIIVAVFDVFDELHESAAAPTAASPYVTYQQQPHR